MINENIEYEVYTEGNYITLKRFATQTRLLGYDIDHAFFQLLPRGTLIIKPGYVNNACSGPTLDDATNIHAGMAHDSMYQMLRIGKLGTGKDFDRNRKLADMTFRDQLKLDGMGWFRRNYYYRAVRWFGKKYALPRNAQV